MAGQLLVSQLHGCEAQLRGRPAIPSESGAQGSAGEVTDLAPDEVGATAGRAAALVAVLGVAIGLAMVPVLVVLVPVTGQWLAAGAVSLVAVVGGVKLAAWGGAWRPDSKRVERSG